MQLPRPPFSSTVVQRPIPAVPQLSSAFAELLRQITFRDPDGMRLSFDDLSSAIRQHAVGRDLTSELKSGFRTWLSHQHEQTVPVEELVMTMPAGGEKRARLFATLFWAIEHNEEAEMRSTFLKTHDLMHVDTRPPCLANIRDILCAAFGLWELGEPYVTRLVTAKREFDSDEKKNPDWKCGCGYAMKKSLFETCPVCDDHRSWYELPRPLRAGESAITAKYHEKPQWYHAWLCKRPDWEFQGRPGDQCCNNWNWPTATSCNWCGAYKGQYCAEVAEDGDKYGTLPVAPHTRWTDRPATVDVVYIQQRNKASSLRKWRSDASIRRDGWSTW